MEQSETTKVPKENIKTWNKQLEKNNMWSLQLPGFLMSKTIPQGQGLREMCHQWSKCVFTLKSCICIGVDNIYSDQKLTFFAKCSRKPLKWQVYGSET